MRNDDIEFLSLDDTDSFGDDFMLVTKTKKEPKKEVEDKVLSFDDIKIERPKEEPKPEPVKTEPVRTRSEKYEPKEQKEEIIEEKKEVKPKKEKKMKPKKEKTKRKSSKKVRLFQLIFILISVFFIGGCMIFYGTRLIKYYKIYNPKNEKGEAVQLFGNSVVSANSLATEGKGLYRIGGAYVFKGDVENNYVKFNGLLWRILKVNSDNSVDLISEEPINELKWNKEYTSFDKSDIKDYLNNKFLKVLDENSLTTTSYCLDTINLDDESEKPSAKCENTVTDDKVRLLTVNEFLNSMVDGATFLTSEISDYMWLSNVSNDKVWHTNGTSVSTSEADSGYIVRPVIHVKNSVTLVSGEGTSEKPFMFTKEDNKPKYGSYVKLGDDNWVVYETSEDTLKLVLENPITKTNHFSRVNSTFELKEKTNIGYYLNNDYYKSLSYKDILVETDWMIGTYENSYKDSSKTAVRAFVGLQNVEDLKVNIDASKSCILTTSENDFTVYMVASTLRTTKVGYARNIKPTICIKKDVLKAGKGTKEEPFTIEQEGDDK